MSKRRHIPLIEIAAALAAEKFGIPHEHRVLMTAAQVLSLGNPDHDPIPHAHGGEDRHFNLTFRSIMQHREKTAKIDIPMLAKTKRLVSADAKHKAIMAAKIGLESENMAAVADALAPVGRRPRPKRTIQNPGFSKEHRPMRSRNSFQQRNVT